MKALILILLCGLLSFSVAAQSKDVVEQPLPEVKNNDQPIFTIVEQMPEYNGGNEVLSKDLSKIINYPSDAVEKNESGTVYVSFVIEKDGSISNARVIRGVSKSLDKEALRVVSKLPKWKPGTQNGKQVRVQYNLPIKFSLK